MDYSGKETVVAAQTLANADYYARSGPLEVRCSRSEEEILEAQRLRYHIFYEEMSAQPTLDMQRQRRDMDAYDPLCDHLLVIDHSKLRGEQVVGTYRLLRQRVAEQHDGFYSAQEYDLGPLMGERFQTHMGKGGQLLELGRSCVHRDYRTNTTITLLWKGIAGYLAEHNIAYMFGCASLHGTDPESLRLPLSYLYHEHLCPADFMVRAVPDRFVDMNMQSRDGMDIRMARRALPPLIKGYLRLGCFIGDGAVVDYQFGTTDVFILLPVERVTKRYSVRFGTPGAVNDGDGDSDVAAIGE
ncbi:ornithine-acyl ACP N-acyltransferase [Iodidimonas muriae]|uniref:L-ornithine N(alpha)-acyltransferase n=1 Tax=Iodidimonas muriae TaxID=261467 RepID=A0ABQ2LAE0_9PROT|nr:GNAT family N-acyltransferase [Iodidimonas muriae]GER05912.1 ornithine-acyl ACP N-acyltransferase [Kordiimonadales bacterium JCM 17843]GGO07394.1 ornithine-acyl ACP N-acyltransferase [Iodidimonas muriae]